jgi:hypothetical protein
VASNQRALADTLADHLRVKFPERPISDNLADWMLDLAETDAYYVGLAKTVLRGVEVEANIRPWTDLKKGLERVLADGTAVDDAVIVVQADGYLDSLDRLATCLIRGQPPRPPLIPLDGDPLR